MNATTQTWIDPCRVDDIEEEGVDRLNHAGRTVAVYRGLENDYFCTAGLCTHEAIHLAEDLVIDYEIECPKHLGVFDIRAGEAKRLPACVNLRTYPAKVDAGRVLIVI